MGRLGDKVEKIRSKNAGPFWVTIDVFCKQDGSFSEIAQALALDLISEVYATEIDAIRLYEIPDLDVIKISIPRPNYQGTKNDRDMHGASFSVLLEEVNVS